MYVVPVLLSIRISPALSPAAPNLVAGAACNGLKIILLPCSVRSVLALNRTNELFDKMSVSVNEVI